MVDFSELPIANGVGPVHMNRTRTVINPRAGLQMPNGYGLYNKLPDLLDAKTASCYLEAGKQWNREWSLWFRGVPRLRPFVVLPSITIPPVAGVPVPVVIPIPDSIREAAIPAWHTDHVGIVMAGERSVTVQTLKRDSSYITSDDKVIQNHIESVIVMLLKPALIAAGSAGQVVAQALKYQAVRRVVAWPLVEYALHVNRHHFLAGRRSFLMQPGPNGNWVFETAALERYSRTEFSVVSDYVMGGASSAVKPVWVQMGHRVAAAFGTLVGTVDHQSAQVENYGDDVNNSPFWADISSRHSHLAP